LEGIFKSLAEAEDNMDCQKAREILQVAVKGFKPSSPVVDLFASKPRSQAVH